MRKTAISIKGQAGDIEGIWGDTESTEKKKPSVLLCHGHPAFNENMQSTLCEAMASELAMRGFVSLRFNFRGVGDSAGIRSNGESEFQDVLSAVKALRSLPNVDKKRVFVVGHSFGAAAIIKSLKKLGTVKALAFLAPPINALSQSSIRADRRPKLILAGLEDKVSPLHDIKPITAEYDTNTMLISIRGDHLFQRNEPEAASLLAEFLTEENNK
jgi:alpha/beta superfamily hydrolase